MGSSVKRSTNNQKILGGNMSDNHLKEVVAPKSIKQMAREELEQELVGEQKEKLKRKLKEQYLAKQVVANLEREISDLELEIDHKLKGL